ncbi:MAG: hypothetical protein NPIRA02_22930 [Nitrospirales bacterium]|nr:MAG: hypothetical protein NPIRA02_22930 [Nitrospirales bacterium]
MTKCATHEPKHWMSYLIDSLVNSGALLSWEALDYVTSNLLGESPNAQLHHSKAPYEATQQLLNRVYGPIVEAASRTIDLPTQAMIHMFTDISLIGKSAVLVVYFPGDNQPHQLLLLDSAPAWDLVFESETHFNRWAEERYQWIIQALQAIVTGTRQTSELLDEQAIAQMV